MGLALQTFRCGPLDNGVYVLYDANLGVATIVDPSFESDPAWEFILRHDLRLEAIVTTHGHFDHVVGNAAWHERAPDAPLYLHPADAALLAEAPQHAAWFGLRVPPPPAPDRAFAAGEQVTFAGQPWDVLHVPGHSPGSICLYRPGMLIGGDVLFRGSIGRTDLPGGDHDLLVTGIHEQLLALPDETVVYPGHGPLTTIGDERRENPFLR
ncbi:MAG TPA: MBL fold metallo-hydrolase [Chloroflexota bacterium]|jgi:glyoxylase-like metal-dependent hydrolase (beta-lactamase superfamily II)|nr:MBL fold metallo-hydrolase [Chloroflexota bacterium]